MMMIDDVGDDARHCSRSARGDLVDDVKVIKRRNEKENREVKHEEKTMMMASLVWRSSCIPCIPLRLFMQKKGDGKTTILSGVGDDVYV